jgi:Domain of unknown function (DUF4267)
MIALLYNNAREVGKATPVHLAALLVGLIACARDHRSRHPLPAATTLDFGVAADNLRALTEIKGARDITSGAVLLVVLAPAGRVTFGWALIAAAITPTADTLIVLTNGGQLAKALSVHALTAALLIAAASFWPWPERDKARRAPGRTWRDWSRRRDVIELRPKARESGRRPVSARGHGSRSELRPVGGSRVARCSDGPSPRCLRTGLRLLASLGDSPFPMCAGRVPLVRAACVPSAAQPRARSALPPLLSCRL